MKKQWVLVYRDSKYDVQCQADRQYGTFPSHKSAMAMAKWLNDNMETEKPSKVSAKVKPKRTRPTHLNGV